MLPRLTAFSVGCPIVSRYCERLYELATDDPIYQGVVGDNVMERLEDLSHHATTIATKKDLSVRALAALRVLVRVVNVACDRLSLQREAGLVWDVVGWNRAMLLARLITVHEVALGHKVEHKMLKSFLYADQAELLMKVTSHAINGVEAFQEENWFALGSEVAETMWASQEGAVNWTTIFDHFLEVA